MRTIHRQIIYHHFCGICSSYPTAQTRLLLVTVTLQISRGSNLSLSVGVSPSTNDVPKHRILGVGSCVRHGLGAYRAAFLALRHPHTFPRARGTNGLSPETLRLNSSSCPIPGGMHHARKNRGTTHAPSGRSAYARFCHYARKGQSGGCHAGQCH